MILDGIASGLFDIPKGDYLLYNLERHLQDELRHKWTIVFSHVDDNGVEIYEAIPPYIFDIPFVCF